MANQRAVEYIRQRMAQGVAQGEITSELKASGWQDGDIAAAFVALDPNAPVVPAPSGQPLPGAGVLLSEAWALFQSRITTLLGIMLVPMLASALSMGSFVAFGYFGPQLISKAGMMLPIAGFVVLLILLVIMQVWGSVSLLFAVKDSAEHIGIGEA